jgi:hypothetical protein
MLVKDEIQTPDVGSALSMRLEEKNVCKKHIQAVSVMRTILFICIHDCNRKPIVNEIKSTHRKSSAEKCDNTHIQMSTIYELAVRSAGIAHHTTPRNFQLSAFERPELYMYMLPYKVMRSARI